MARTLSPQQMAQKNDRLEILSAVVPGISAFFGQIVMLIVMVFNKQYLYLVFLIPGIISAFAIAVIMLLRWRMRKSLPAAAPEITAVPAAHTAAGPFPQTLCSVSRQKAWESFCLQKAFPSCTVLL